MRTAVCQLFALASLVGFAVTQSPPVVDLGYQLHRGNLDPTGSFYNFSNIRYADSPTGENRFKAPQPPKANRSFIHNGMHGRMCPQANPAWFTILPEWLPTYAPGAKVNVTKKQLNELKNYPQQSLDNLIPSDPRITEDCLFLDVLVPTAVIESQKVKRSTGRRQAPPTYSQPPTYPTGGAPVLVWIYGGGYTSGDKTSFDAGTSPAGLIKASQSDAGENTIFVALNYRLGAFGWLSGSTVQSDGVANAGLLDQRFALDWIQSNIHLFGGDPTRVTVLGESAGGGSIMHHITSYGGQGPPVPFKQAVMQSPAFVPYSSEAKSEAILQQFLQYAGVSSLEEARQASSETLIIASGLQVARSMYGTYTYGPVTDGSYVPAPPGVLLAEGKFDHDVNVMVAYNADEGLLFTNPTIESEEEFVGLLTDLDPTLSNQTITEITSKLYPAEFNGQYGYTDAIGRQADALGQLVVSCNANYIDRAFNNQTYNYIFAVPPALHSQDVPYTFYDGVDTVSGTLGPQQIDAVVAAALQQLIITFVVSGHAEYGTANGTMALEQYGPNEQVLVLNVTGVYETTSPANTANCLFLQDAFGSG